MYNKIFTKILDSSIWLESTPTRIVWLTFIAVMDEKGFAPFAALGNVANRARVTLDEARTAIDILEGPDPESSDPDNDGRRLERVPGGWLVLNAEKHRDLVTRAVRQAQTAERVRKYRERKRNSNAPVTQSEAVSVSVTEEQSRSFPVTKNKPDRKAGVDTKANGNGHLNARSKHPIFQGQRFVVFDWMLEDIGRMLGSHLDAFDVHDWFFALDSRAVRESLVKAKNDWWPWIQQELVIEAQKRGLPMEEQKKFGITPKTAGNAAALKRFAERKTS